MRKLSGMLLVLGLTVLVTPPARAQRNVWQDKWYWGAQGSVYLFKTTTQSSFTRAYGAGGHWFITSKRLALDLMVHELFFETGSTSAVPNASSVTGLTTVDFTRGRMLSANIYAVPTDAFIQPYAGIGFAINQVTNAVPQGPFATTAEQNAALSAVQEQGTKAFVVLSVGLQWHVSRWALFGQYQYMPSGGDFLITGVSHSFLGGLRYALTGASEQITTQR